MNLLDGKKVSEEIYARLKNEVIKLREFNITPELHAILVGDDPASKVYVSIKERTCKSLGINSVIHELPYNTTQEELEELILELNNNVKVNGVLIQLPLPKAINAHEVMDLIDYKKDVDGLNKNNLARLIRNEECLRPCTPEGIIHLLDYYSISTDGKNVVIIGQSDIVGKPLSYMLSNNYYNATVTNCHVKTDNLSYYTLNADLIIIGIGVPNFLTSDMIKEDSVIIDVGINRVNNKLVGDVDFDSVSRKAGYITPVPGGVGPMTVACLMNNTKKAARIQNNIPY